MLLPVLALIVGLLLLIWSADRFVEGSAGAAYRLGVAPLLVGMVIVGFGTSAPEIVVSVLASIQGNPGLALGNAIGSNISNIALILGVTAIVSPIIVHSSIVRKEIPILVGVSFLLVAVAWDRSLSRWDGAILLVCFISVMAWSIYTATRKKEDPLTAEFDEKLSLPQHSLAWCFFWVIAGMLLLIGSSQLLVWGAVRIAVALGVSDLVVGLTIVAIGTSLPELASSIAATKKGEHDIALGNVIGSNLFNTLCVIGLASFIHPLEVEKDVFLRDLPVMGAATMLLFFSCIGFAGKGRVTRPEGVFLVLGFAAYLAWVVYSALQTAEIPDTTLMGIAG